MKKPWTMSRSNPEQGWSEIPDPLRLRMSSPMALLERKMRMRHGKMKGMRKKMLRNRPSSLEDLSYEVSSESHRRCTSLTLMCLPCLIDGTTTLQCYDGIHTKWATCIDFINNTNIKWDRYRRAILHFMLRPDIAEASEEKTHTFAVRAINYGRVDDALGNYRKSHCLSITPRHDAQVLSMLAGNSKIRNFQQGTSQSKSSTPVNTSKSTSLVKS